MLKVVNAQVFYDGSVEAVRDVSFEVPKGQIVCLLGPNGSGKTTLLKAISGVLYPERGALVKGTIRFGEMELAGDATRRHRAPGIVHVPEGRRLFATLTVEENLIVGGATLSANERARRLARAYEIFPDIATHRHRISGYLSGGQQQMVALARPCGVMRADPGEGRADNRCRCPLANSPRSDQARGHLRHRLHVGHDGTAEGCPTHSRQLDFPG